VAKRLVCLLFAFLLGFFVAGEVWARAGGGGGYSGGGGGGGYSGGGSSFSGGSSSGGGGNLGPLIYFLIRNPVIGVPVLIVIVLLLYYGNRKGTQSLRARTIRKAMSQQDLMRRAAALDAIRRSDPAFDPDQFLKRCRSAFLQIQSAWSQQKLTTVRPFISDGIYERFSLQLQEQRDLGYRNEMQDVRVNQAQVAEAIADEPFDVLTVQLDAAATDYRVRLDSGKEISGSRRDESFTEYWTFLRRRGANTQADKAGLLEGCCPNCGAPIEMNQSARCASCDSALRSGEHDWVLSEITQACEWEPTRRQEIPGVASYRQARDAEFNVHHLEDRASVVFWRKVMLDRTADPNKLRKMASAEFLERYVQEELQPREDGSRFFLGDCAVGSVELRGVIPGEDWDRAPVEVRWSGTVYRRLPSGELKATSDSVVRVTLLVLGRRPGAKSALDRAISSAHCPSCGAPETDAAGDACEYCGTVLNDGNQDWVLLSAPLVTEPEGQNLLRRLYEILRAEASPATAPRGNDSDNAAALPLAGADTHGSGMLAWLIKTMTADGHLDDKERRALKKVAQRRQVPAERLGMMIAAAESGQVALPEPANDHEARRWLTAMADASLIDGRLRQQEINLLTAAGERLGMSSYDVRSLLKQRRSALYKAARQQLHKSKVNGGATSA